MKGNCFKIILILIIVCLSSCSRFFEKPIEKIDNYSIMELTKLDDRNSIEIQKSSVIPHKIIRDTLGLDSLIFAYFKDGVLYKRLPYKNGKLNGRFEEYYFNGQLKYRVYYENGIQINGLCYVYNINGSIYSISNIKNGYEYGYTRIYINDEIFKIRKYDKKGKLKRLYNWNEFKKKWIISYDY